MDFNQYANNSKQNKDKNKKSNTYGVDDNLFNLVSSIAGKYNGKSQNELLKAIYEEAKKGKERGTLTNTEIDNFVAMLTPMLDEKKRKVLYKVADELKKI